MSDEKKKPKKKRLTLRERKFVQVTARTLRPREGVEAAYNPSNPHSARNMASALMQKPHIQAALQQEMMRLERDAVNWADQAMAAEIGEGTDDEGRPRMKWGEKLKWAELILKLGKTFQKENPKKPKDVEAFSWPNELDDEDGGDE